MSNYREIPALLRQRVPFDGNSMSARWLAIDGGLAYVVFSYDTEIARFQSADGTRDNGVKIFNDRKYSHTTSRHQNLAHANL